MYIIAYVYVCIYVVYASMHIQCTYMYLENESICVYIYIYVLLKDVSEAVLETRHASGTLERDVADVMKEQDPEATQVMR